MPEPPVFPYHPDPVATGAVVPSDGVCACCGQARGHLYRGPVYAEADLGGRVCPWCIADGGVADRFDAHFTAGECLGEDVPQAVFERVDRRTPGFTGWQEPRWFFHCGDAAAYLGPAGSAELAGHPDALQVLRTEIGTWGWPDHQAEEYLRSLDPSGEPTAHLFRCLHCRTHLAYSDTP
ncbi:CbrC family protein [Streptomyces yaizuensis]|uniref:CbrC family protein n=1 Tax=Streptomyces yaizuensis TaxID=2989713 RepID=A0ABQ5NY62_9ACTN|nr:CbrC family protein [Streptomyces sp. YSPA8]GLF95310.1 CbrC family protein [Streptomyces sp. YSPA8]